MHAKLFCFLDFGVSVFFTTTSILHLVVVSMLCKSSVNQLQDAQSQVKHKDSSTSCCFDQKKTHIIPLSPLSLWTSADAAQTHIKDVVADGELGHMMHLKLSITESRWWTDPLK